MSQNGKTNHAQIKEQIIERNYRNQSQNSIQIDSDIIHAEEKLVQLRMKKESRSATSKETG